MATQIKVNVFTKEKTNATTGQKFKLYSAKDKNGNYYDIRFTMECENRNLLPNNKKPFVLVVSSNHLSSKIEKYSYYDEVLKCNVDGENIRLYVDKIDAIEEYVRPDFDTSNF